MKGNIIRRDGSDEAILKIRFKAIERYYEYHSIRELVADWQDQDEWMKEEVVSLEKPKTETRRQIDLFLKRIKNIPRDRKGFYSWKVNEGIYKKGDSQ